MEVTYKRTLVDMVMRQLGFSMDYFELPQQEMITIKLHGKRSIVYSVEVVAPTGTCTVLGVEKDLFDDAVKKLQEAAVDCTECYKVVMPHTKYARYFRTKDEAQELVDKSATDAGLPAPTCSVAKVMRLGSKTYALEEIQFH